MVDMPRDCENCRLRLFIEYNRLLAWAKAVGFIEGADHTSIAASLGTDSAELSGIISHIGRLLELFRELGERWKELNPPQSTRQDEVQIAEINELQGLLSLDAAYLKSSEERKRKRGTNHLVSWMEKTIDGAKEVIAHPRRVRWAAVDKDAFEALLKDLHVLIERLQQLVGDVRLEKIADVTAQTYLELVQARNDIQSLRAMIGATLVLMKPIAAGGDLMTERRARVDAEFRYLLQIKEINRTADDMLAKMEKGDGVDIRQGWGDLITIRRYDGTTLARHFEYATTDGKREHSTPARFRGTLNIDGQAIQAWLEWRQNGTTQNDAESIRVIALAQMLHASKPQSLNSPTCLGYVDDTAANGRFGWIFAMPGNSKRTVLRSLHSILGDVRYKPTLRQRVTLASKLASSLLHLHTCDWLHKGFHSGNISFPFDEESYDPTEPIISGFDYSRSQGSKTISSSFEPKWDIYRWPGIQNEAPKASSSRKTYDIYSLGLLLLEVAHWKPLPEMMCLEDWPENTSHDCWIRAWLLGDDDPPFDVNPLLSLRDIAGDRYWRVAVRCIEAHGAKGMDVEEFTDQTWSAKVGMKIQRHFNTLVVQELKGITHNI